jgi:perosamine synthetase
MKKIPLFRTTFGEEEVAAVREVLLSGWVALGPKTAEFEQAYAKFIGTKYAIGLNSCTAALHLALSVYEFPKGSEVLMSTINFIAAPHSALYNGLAPVFVDVNPGTLQMDPADMEKKITKKTKAIIATHLGGTPADMDAIMRIAKKHKLVVIEDVANAVGGSYKGKMLGSIGDIGCHSFEAKKNMTTGDGGMITLNDTKMAEKLKRVRWLGINKDTWKRFSGGKQGTYSWYYEVSELGYKFNMNDIMAALGLVQLKKLPRILAKKDTLIARYNKAFQNIPWITTPVAEPKGKGAYWLYIIQVPERNAFMTYLEKHGITTGVHFMPMHMHPLYKKTRTVTPIADRVWKNIVSLPLYPNMTKEEQEYVIKTIKNFPSA